MKDHETKNIKIGAALGSLAINFCLIGALTGAKGIVIPLALAQPINYSSAGLGKTMARPIDGQPERKNKVDVVSNPQGGKSSTIVDAMKVSARGESKLTNPWQGHQMVSREQTRQRPAGSGEQAHQRIVTLTTITVYPSLEQRRLLVKVKNIKNQ